MDTYHFRIAMDLACLALGVHALAIMVSYVNRKDEFSDKLKVERDERPRYHQGRRVRIVLLVWRRCCMLVTAILVIVMLSWTNFNLPPKCPVRCADTEFTYQLTRWQKLRNNIEILILVEACCVPFLVDIPRRVEVSEYWSSRWPRTLKLLRFLGGFWFKLSFIAAFAFYFSAGTLLVHDYIEGRSYMEEKEIHSENAMGFGQIIPLLLLMLPFMAAATAYYGESWCPPLT